MKESPNKTEEDRKYDIALSFASENRAFVELVAEYLKQNQIEVFYDKDKQVYNWGKDLSDTLDDVYRNRSKYVVMFISEHYARKMWTNHERQSAFARALQEEREFVLPARFDDTELPGLRPTVAYIDLRNETPATFASKVVEKLASSEALYELARKPETSTGEKVRMPDQSSKDYGQILDSLREVVKEHIEKKRQEAADSRQYGFGLLQGDEEIGPSVLGTYGFARYYQGGFIVWHDTGEYARRAFAVYGAIAHRFQKLRDDRWAKLGFPVSDEADAVPSPFNSTGRISLFEEGQIIWYSSGNYLEQTYAIWGPISRKYNSLRTTGSYLGFPIGEPYPITGGERCDFEGGTILFLDTSKSVQVVRQLLRIDYSDSPFNHDWFQYSGSDSSCISVRPGTSIGAGKSFIAFNIHWGNKAVRYPKSEFRPDELRERYCGVTVKSLTPGGRIRFYIKIKSDDAIDQYLKFDSEIHKKELKLDENEQVKYWRIPLPSDLCDGDWHTLVIDLNEYVQGGFNEPFKWLRNFCFRGHIGVAELVVSDSRDAIEKIVINPLLI